MRRDVSRIKQWARTWGRWWNHSEQPISETIQPVIVLDDTARFAPPQVHYRYGRYSVIVGGATEYDYAVLRPGKHPLQIEWLKNYGAPAILYQTLDTDTVGSLVTEVTSYRIEGHIDSPQSLIGNADHARIFEGGFAGAIVPTLGPAAVNQGDYRDFLTGGGWIILPGQEFVLQTTAVNQTMAYALIWRELPAPHHVFGSPSTSFPGGATEVDGERRGAKASGI